MQTQRSRVKWRKGAKDKSAKYTNRTLHKFHRSRCASTGVVRTRCRNQEDWCEFNALQFGFAYVDRAAGSYNTTMSYGIRRLPKPLSNSLQAQPCFNPSGSRLLTVHVDRDLQHWFWCFSSRSMHEQADLYYNVLGRLSISDSA